MNVKEKHHLKELEVDYRKIPPEGIRSRLQENTT
jgi:hypothetical protein